MNQWYYDEDGKVRPVEGKVDAPVYADKKSAQAARNTYVIETIDDLRKSLAELETQRKILKSRLYNFERHAKQIKKHNEENIGLS